MTEALQQSQIIEYGRQNALYQILPRVQPFPEITCAAFSQIHGTYLGYASTGNSIQPKISRLIRNRY